jgi:aerobic carbon-monoxide dehydrogenase small subunit
VILSENVVPNFLNKFEASSPENLKHSITVNVNGVKHDVQVESRTLLVDLIREQLHLTGTHIGCIEGKCGACTVMIDGVAQKSCLIFAVQAEDCNILTIEGLEKDGSLDPLQQSFWDNHAAQCGYCTSGMLMTAKWFLSENPSPTRDEIRMGLSGNLCRCTGYVKIVEAIENAAESHRASKLRS